MDTLMEKYRMAGENNRKLLAYRPFPSETLRSLREFYRVGLTYSSNALEGNSLTESETKVVIEDGLTIEGKPLRDVYEAVGHARAYDFLQQMAVNKPLAEEDILVLHRLFYQQIDVEHAGCYRTMPVFISGSRHAVTSHAEIPLEMKRLVTWFNRSESKLHPVELAALLHEKFVFIHPFVDGNGRVARLLMNFALLRNEYTIALIPAMLRHEYIAALELAHADGKPFKEFIADRVIATQIDLLRLLADSGGVNKANGGVNEEGNGGVNSLSIQIMTIVVAEPGLNAPAIARRLGKSLRTVQRYLKMLSVEQKLEFRGAPKNGGYYKSL